MSHSKAGEDHRFQKRCDWVRVDRKARNREDCAELAAHRPQTEEIALPILAQNSSSLRLAERFCSVGLVAVFFVAMASAQALKGVPDVTAITLEDLMDLQVTSVSKRSQKLADAAAAIFVITQEDIRRSGATTIPEVLRMVPGLEVARIDENKWAIGSRGFNGRFDNKLLVLIDGRSVYTPLFSGVYWNVQDVMLEDIDRIEVIRGPGATLWGANAVDGVINIITLPAKSTQGALATAEGGSEERTAESVRYGGQLGANTSYRAFVKYFDFEPSTESTGQQAHDGWDERHAGFRTDWTPPGPDSLTLQGDVYLSRYGENLTIPSLSAPYSSTFPNDGSYSGGNFLGRWNHAFAKSSLSLQAYYDKTNVTDQYVFVDHETVYDVELQDDIHAGKSQDLVWGLGYRSIQDRNDPSSVVSLSPDHINLNEFSGFVQDEISLADKRLRITIGSKFEHNDFTGFEGEPNARLLWAVTPGQSLWAAISRAVRTPAITEENIQLSEAVIPPGVPPLSSPLPAVISVLGSHQFQAEDLLAYETGYRIQATSSLSADIAGFYNNYANLRSAEPGAPFVEANPIPTDIVIPFVASNKMSGGSYGLELFADWRVLPKWKLFGSYSYLQMNIYKDKNSQDPTADLPAGQNPRNQFFLRSSMDLPKKLEGDLTLRYVDKLPSLNISSYYSLDARLGWKPNSLVEFSVDGQNLTNDKHLEFIPEFINTAPTQVKASVYGKITWRF